VLRPAGYCAGRSLVTGQSVAVGELALSDDGCERRIDPDQFNALAGAATADHLLEGTVSERREHPIRLWPSVLGLFYGKIEALPGDWDVMQLGMENGLAHRVANRRRYLVGRPAFY
jgi:hypothetical protein